MSLVGHWPLTEQAGQANDYSGNDNHGTVNGASRGAASPGGITGYSFDGTDDYIDISSLSVSSGSLSFSFWYKNDYSFTSSENKLSYLFDSSSGRFVISTDRYDTTTGGELAYYDGSWHIAGDTPEDGVWHHFAFCLDAGTNTGRVYQDGVEIFSGSYSSTGLGGTTHIGKTYSTTSNYLEGELADFRIYNHALSPLEVEALHDNGMVGQPTDGVAKYAFEGDAVDSWGGNDGTVNGATFTDGIRGQAASFDGVDDEIKTPLSPVPSTPTFSAWIKPNTFGDGNGYETKVVTTGSTDNMSLGVSPSGQIRSNLYNSSTQVSYTATGPSLSSGEWVFVLTSYDGTNLRLYVNGVLCDTVNAGITFEGSSADFTIGNHNSAPRHFDGLIDDLRIYPYALTSRQIQAIYRGWSDVVRPPEDGVAYYPLDGNATDQWGTNDGTVNGATEATGLRGRCYSFDGTDDYISVPHDSSISPDRVTVSCWVNADEWANRHTIVNKFGNSTTGVDGYDGPYGLRVLDGDLDFGIGPHGDSTNYYASTPVPNETNQWYHLVGTYDGSTIALYVNGVLKNTTAYSTSNLADYSTPLVIGRENGEVGRYWDGNIDDVRIYDYALAPHEVHALYRWGMGGRDLRKNLVNA